jgi:hypothetical protein
VVALEALIHFRRLSQQAPRLPALTQMGGQGVDIDGVGQAEVRVALKDVHQGLGGAGGLLLP